MNVDYWPARDRDSLWLTKSIGSQDPDESILARFLLKVLENMISRPDIVVFDVSQFVQFGVPDLDDFFDFADEFVSSEIHEVSVDERILDTLVPEQLHDMQNVSSPVVFHCCLEVPQCPEANGVQSWVSETLCRVLSGKLEVA